MDQHAAENDLTDEELKDWADNQWKRCKKDLARCIKRELIKTDFLLLRCIKSLGYLNQKDEIREEVTNMKNGSGVRHRPCFKNLLLANRVIEIIPLSPRGKTIPVWGRDLHSVKD